MNEQFELWLQKYRDGALSGDELAQLQAALLADAARAERFAEVTRADALLESLLSQDAAARHMAALVQQIEQDTAPATWLAAAAPVPQLELLEPGGRRPAARRRTRATSRLGWAAAVAALLVLGGVGLWLAAMLAGNPSPWDNVSHAVVAGQVLVNGSAAERLRDGTALVVGPSAPAVIRLADGSEAQFRSSTRAVLHGRRDAVRQVVELLEGGGTFRVTKGDGRFRVETGVGSVTALGTEFTVELVPDQPLPGAARNRRDDALQVSVASGIVEVEYGRHTLLMAGGEEALFRDDREPTPPRQMTQRFVSLDLPGRRLHTLAGTEVPVPSEHRVAPECAVRIDGQPATPDQLRPAMRVRMTFSLGGTVVAVEALGPTVRGVVRSVDARSGRITLVGKPREDSSPGDRQFAAAAAVLQGIEPGQRVTLILSADESKVIRIQPDVRGEEGTPSP